LMMIPIADTRGEPVSSSNATNNEDALSRIASALESLDSKFEKIIADSDGKKSGTFLRLRAAK